MAPNNNNTDHDIGRLSEAVRLLQHAVEALDKEVKAMNLTISEAKGGWRVLLLLGGSAAGIGALLGSWWTHAVEILGRAPK